MLLLLILTLGLIAQFFLPWWIIAPVAFGLAAWRASSAGQAFGAGFLGIGLGWLGASLLIHLRTGGILTARMAELLPLHSSAGLIGITVLVGGLVGGLAALSGYLVRRAVRAPVAGR